MLRGKSADCSMQNMYFAYNLISHAPIHSHKIILEQTFSVVLIVFAMQQGVYF